MDELVWNTQTGWPALFGGQSGVELGVPSENEKRIPN